MIPSRKLHLIVSPPDERNHDFTERLAKRLETLRPDEWSGDRIAREHVMQALFADKNYTREQALVGLQIVSGWSTDELVRRMAGKCAEEIREYAMEWKWE